MLIQTNILSSYIILSMLIFRHCYYDNNCKYNNRYYNNSSHASIFRTSILCVLIEIGEIYEVIAREVLRDIEMSQFILVSLFTLLTSFVISFDLKTGIIYMIQCQITGKVYIGRTTREIDKAMMKNKSRFESYKRGSYKSNDRIFQVITNKDYNVTILEIIYELENDTNFLKTLLKQQRLYIEQYNSVNKNVPSRTKKEYYVDNIDNILKYRQRIKPSMQRMVTCEVCGVQLSRAALFKHNKSLRHLTALAKFNQAIVPSES